MDSLPLWLQWLVSLATILSSIGVIIAFVQLRISGKQFERQLRITKQQFKITNQGYINLALNYNLSAGDHLATQDELLNPDTMYCSIRPVAVLENVGNLPVYFTVDSFILFCKGQEKYQIPDVAKQAKNVLYPKQSTNFYLGEVFFNDQHTLIKGSDILDLNITIKLLITYNDYNDKTRKTIDRDVSMSGSIFINTIIRDRL